jgi:membrane protein
MKSRSRLQSRHSRLVSIGKIIRQSCISWFTDDAPSMGAAIAFYSLFAIAPILLIVIWVAGAFIGPDVVQAQILAQMRNLLGDHGTAAVGALLTSARYSAQAQYSTAAEIVTLLIGASSVFAELQNALNRIWRTAPVISAGRGLWHLIRVRLLSLGFILIVGFLLLVSLIAAAAFDVVGSWFGLAAERHQLVYALNVMADFAMTTVLFAAIYKYIPEERTAWGDVWVGALVTAGLFTAGKLLIVVYLGKIAVTSAYGIAGSFLVLLLWVYYSAQIFLLGAEFSRNYAYELGSRVAERSA